MFAYDAENHLVNFNGGVAKYVYDGDGHRVKKITSTATIAYVYNARGQLSAEYGGPPPTVGGTSYLITDHLGSTRVVTDATQAVLSRHDYFPFGEEIYNALGNRNTDPNYNVLSGPTQRFTAKERDPEFGLDYFLARYYSGAQGRFTSPDEFTGGPDDVLEKDDPASQALPYCDIDEPQSLNKYAYAYNNPLRYIDPDGHKIKYVGQDGPPTDNRVILILENIDRQNGSRDVIVTSGYRSPETNARTPGAAKESYHTMGKAADIVVPGQTPEQTASQAVKAGATGVSTYDKSKGTPRVHLDVRTNEWNGKNGKTMQTRPEWRSNPDKVLGTTSEKPAPPPQPSLWERIKATINEYLKK
jgi:RHS repeat-associated protein